VTDLTMMIMITITSRFQPVFSDHNTLRALSWLAGGPLPVLRRRQCCITVLPLHTPSAGSWSIAHCHARW